MVKVTLVNPPEHQMGDQSETVIAVIDEKHGVGVPFDKETFIREFPLDRLQTRGNPLRVLRHHLSDLRQRGILAEDTRRATR